LGKRILIVDDEVELADIIAIYFQRQGWQTSHAAHGKQALSQLDSFQPDVILSDIIMPEMDGMELLIELDRRQIEIPLIFITGFRDIDKMRKAWGLCAFDFLDKPFNEKTMIAVAENAYEHGRHYVRSARKRYKALKKAA